LPADWADRIIVTVAQPAQALFAWDLDAVEREHLDRFLRTSPPQHRQTDEAAYEESVLKWQEYLAAVRTGPESKVESSKGPEAEEETKMEPAEVKQSFFSVPPADPVMNCPSGRIPLTPPWAHRFTAEQGQLIRLTVSDLRPAPGYLWPDPVVWLVRLDRPGDPETGAVVALSDDGPEGLPLIEHEAEHTAEYRLVMAPYAPSHAGLASIELEVDGHTIYEAQAAFFGGSPYRLDELKPGDMVFAGADPATSGRQDHDSVLLLLPPPWNVLPARYSASNNETGTLPLLRVEETVKESFLVVGSFHERSDPSVRVFVSKISPERNGVAKVDADGDWLSAEIEGRLLTCDDADRARNRRCRSPEPLPNGWDASDTDNDGLLDFEEVFGVRRCYAAAGEPPYYDVPACIKGPGGNCAHFCPEDTGMEAQLPLSAMDAPDPTEYDIYLEYDYWQGENEPQGKHAIPADQVRLMERAFQKDFVHDPEGGPCQDWFCPPRYPIRFHLFQDDAVDMPDLSGTAHIPSLANRSLFFDLFFTPDRKYTNTFHYMLGKHKGGGQTDVCGRAAIVGASGGAAMTLKIIHEAGHLLGLRHNYFVGNPDYTPFHLSVMSYGYSHTVPPPILWDGAFKPCSPGKQCPPHFKCVHFRGHGKLCAPDCGVSDSGPEPATHYARISTGELSALFDDFSEEGTIPESGYPLWFPPYLYCYNDSKKGLSHLQRFRRFSDPLCDNGRCVESDGETCRIDWNKDGRFDGADAFDIDRDGKLNPHKLPDGDEHFRILEKGKLGLRVLSKKTVAAFYTGFLGFSGNNVMPYPAVVHEHHGGYATDVTNFCDEAAKWPHCREQKRQVAALFRGPASGDQAIEVRIPPEFCLKLERGVTFSIRAKPFRVPPEEHPAVLCDSPNVRILLWGEPEDAVWAAEVKSAEGEWERLELADSGALGRWTRLTVSVNNKKSVATFTAKRGTTLLESREEGLTVSDSICSFSIGAAGGSTTNFVGFLDDPMLLSGPGRGL